MKKVKVDGEKCLGCGSCVALASKSFKMEKGKAVTLDPAGDSEEVIQSAIDSCPVGAINWVKE